MTRFASIGYLPKRSVGHTASFLSNLDTFPAINPVHLYTYDWTEREGVIKLPAPVEQSVQPGKDGKPNPVHLFNRIFYTSLSMAASMGLTHYMFIEHDCRFGVDGWDQILFDEFLRKNEDAVCGGTPVIFNPSSYSREVAVRFEKYLAGTRKRSMPMHIQAAGAFGERQEPCLFPLAALAIYQVKWMLEAFPEIRQGKTFELSHSTKLHDQEVGRRLWRHFGPGIFDQVTWLGKEYSGYKDILSDEDHRRTLLESGQVVAVHQIKSDWKGPVKSA